MKNASRQLIDCEEEEAVEEATTDKGIREHIMLSHYMSLTETV